MSDKRGFITAAAELLNASPNVPAGAAKAWMETFAGNPARAAIAGSYAAAHIAENPAEALGLAKDFTSWERRQFLDAAIPSWAAKDPAAALGWFREQNEPLSDSLRGRIFDAWAQANLDSARDELETLTDPAERLEMARALGRVMATEGTREAVAWADSLNDPAVHDAAHEAIYEATPRGIGTLMVIEGGFPTIKGVLPGSVAQKAGLLEGDRLVEISSGSGEFAPLYGKAHEDALSSIRGEPGPARIRILRNGSDGRPAELVFDLTREQLVLPPPKRSEKRPAQ
jgi:C-terminal processing protease CtpA/Prc